MAYGCAIGLSRSIDFLLEVGDRPHLRAQRRLADLLIEGLRDRDLEITSPLADAERSAIVTARKPGFDSAQTADATRGRRGSWPRREATRSGSLPISTPVEEDIERTLACLDEVLV